MGSYAHPMHYFAAACENHDLVMEEVICRINPANSDLFAGLIRQIVTYLPD